MGCREYEPLIERMLAEEIGRAERDRLLEHTEECPGCREFVDLHHRLMEPDENGDLPTDAEFARMRESVLATVRQERTSTPPARVAWSDRRSAWSDLFGLFAMRPALAGGFAAALLVMLVGGIAVGRGLGFGGMTLDGGSADAFARQIGNAASERRGIDDIAESPYLYSNVRFDEQSDGKMALSFDVTRHLQIQRDAGDPLVREVMAQSLLNPEPLATRLEAVAFAGRAPDPLLEQVLIHAMLNDPDLAVRLKALKILSTYPPDEQLAAAFIMVLSGEEAVRMRMLALDYLAASQSISAERLDGVMQNLQNEDDRALMVRYVDELNGS